MNKNIFTEEFMNHTRSKCVSSRARIPYSLSDSRFYVLNTVELF